jgi:hypothetical protein
MHVSDYSKQKNLLCCMHMQETQCMQQLVNNFSATAKMLIHIHQLLSGVSQAYFTAAACSLSNVNVILIVRCPWSESYTRAIADGKHGVVNR